MDYGPEVSKQAFVVHHTEFPEFRNCRRKWFFGSRNGLNLEPLIKDVKLRLGSLWHEALAARYRYRLTHPHGDPEAARAATRAQLMRSLAEDKEAIRTVLGDGIYDPDIQAGFKKEENLLLGLVDPYDEWATGKLSPPCYPQDDEFQVVAVEPRFTVPIPASTGKPRARGWLSFKPDAIVKWDGKLWVMEHKLMRGDVDNPTHLPLDLQMGMQVWGLQRQIAIAGFTSVVGLTGYCSVVGGAIYNLTRKQLPGPRVTKPIFGRHVVLRSSTELRNLAQDLGRDIQNMKRAIKDPILRWYNPQPWSGICTWGCPSRAVCEAMNRGEDVAYLLSKFRERGSNSLLEAEEE